MKCNLEDAWIKYGIARLTNLILTKVSGLSASVKLHFSLYNIPPSFDDKSRSKGRLSVHIRKVVVWVGEKLYA